MAQSLVGSPANDLPSAQRRLRSIRRSRQEQVSLASPDRRDIPKMSFEVTDREMHDGSSTFRAGTEGAEAAEDGERGCHENSV